MSNVVNPVATVTAWLRHPANTDRWFYAFDLTRELPSLGLGAAIAALLVLEVEGTVESENDPEGRARYRAVTL